MSVLLCPRNVEYRDPTTGSLRLATMTVKPKELTLRSLILGALITTIFTAANAAGGGLIVTIRLPKKQTADRQ